MLNGMNRSFFEGLIYDIFELKMVAKYDIINIVQCCDTHLLGALYIIPENEKLRYFI